MKRRDFLKTAGAGVLAGGALARAEGRSPARPNIVYIYTDQQSATMMSCAGNRWLKTPGMDHIARNGIRFTRAYTTNPVCSPARVSLMTGRFPGFFRDDKGRVPRENRGSMRIRNMPDEVKDTTIAAFLKKAGYDLVYGGKKHLPPPLSPRRLGFQDITNDSRAKLAETAAAFIRTPHGKPYFMVLSFINPHDICYMAIRDFATSGNDKQIRDRAKVENRLLDRALEMPEGVTEKEFFEKHCPPVPPNLEPQKDEPEAIRLLVDRRQFRRKARESYTDKDWRRHRFAYCRLTEFVDEHVQTVLAALKESGQEKNTLVMFSSDHGDMDAAHRMEHKSTLYEEAANIPFVAMWKGHIPAGQVDNTHLVSNGLDLLPTVCDYAGIEGVADPRGRSLRPLFEGKDMPWRKTLGMESEVGRMVVSGDGYKYTRYDTTGREEQLLDLNRDPHETTHFTGDPTCATKLAALRKSFDEEWFPGC